CACPGLWSSWARCSPGCGTRRASSWGKAPRKWTRSSPRAPRRRSTGCSGIEAALGATRSREVGAPTHVSLINYSTHEICCKIVYYGPGLGGKTTNIRYVYNRLRPESKGRLISLATDMDRTLFFDFLPLDLGSVKGFRVRFHLYTVPGQVYYDASRKLILRGVDGIVFVVDSLAQRFDANVE